MVLRVKYLCRPEMLILACTETDFFQLIMHVIVNYFKSYIFLTETEIKKNISRYMYLFLEETSNKPSSVNQRRQLMGTYLHKLN